MDALDALLSLAEHVKEDRTFQPSKSQQTRRVHACAAGHDWELLVTGEKWFDTRQSRGGGGAVDLVMHLWGLSFKKAVVMLRQRGI